MDKRQQQRELILKHVIDNNGITTKEANEMCRRFYYCNAAHYVSEILTRMVEGGILIRVKQGQYIAGSRIKSKSQKPSPNQLNLL